jgi:hypothetical protein
MLKQRIERFRKALREKGTNLQIFSQEVPTDEEGFLTLVLISEQGLKQFVAVDAIKRLMDRQTKYIEYYSTDGKGKKLGVSLEWVKQEEDLNGSSKKKLGRIQVRLTVKGSESSSRLIQSSLA